MAYLEAINIKSLPKNSVFLGGGITNCPDWQAEVKVILENNIPDVMLVNPRRENFDVTDKSNTKKQIYWEYEYLQRCKTILFWFPKETLNPITLYELGAWSMTDKPLFIGCHPEYERIEDVIIQTKLKRPELDVVFSLDDLTKQVINHFK